MQGIQCLTDQQAALIVSQDRESNQRDLYQSIAKGDFPRWKMQVQIMPELDAENVSYHPFDVTKVWPHKDYPMLDVGVMELNRNPENYFAEVEQAAFCPKDVPPGIGHSPDKMLQLRMTSYAAAQRYRLGINYQSLPVNKPRCEVNNYYKDGKMRFDGNSGGAVNYEPNSFDGPVEDSRFKEPPLRINGDADRYDHHVGNDDYTQAGNLYRLMPPDERNRLHEAIAGSIKDVPKEIIERQLGHFQKADPAYAEGVRKALSGK
jgi:catalase